MPLKPISFYQMNIDDGKLDKTKTDFIALARNTQGKLHLYRANQYGEITDEKTPVDHKVYIQSAPYIKMFQNKYPEDVTTHNFDLEASAEAGKLVLHSIVFLCSISSHENGFGWLGYRKSANMDDIDKYNKEQIISNGFTLSQFLTLYNIQTDTKSDNFIKNYTRRNGDKSISGAYENKKFLDLNNDNVLDKTSVVMSYGNPNILGDKKYLQDFIFEYNFLIEPYTPVIKTKPKVKKVQKKVTSKVATVEPVVSKIEPMLGCNLRSYNELAIAEVISFASMKAKERGYSSPQYMIADTKENILQLNPSIKLTKDGKIPANTEITLIGRATH